MSKLFKYVLIIEIIILISTTLFWWIAGHHTKGRFVDILFVGGAVTIVIGFLIRTGSREGTYSPWYQHFRTFGASTRDERMNIDIEDMNRSYNDFMVLFTAGAIAIGLSALIYIVF